MSFVLLGTSSCNESARPASRKRAMICPSICLLLVLMSPRTPLYRSKAKSQEAYSGPYSLTTDVKCICICMFGVAAALPKSPEIHFRIAQSGRQPYPAPPHVCMLETGVCTPSQSAPKLAGIAQG